MFGFSYQALFILVGAVAIGVGCSMLWGHWALLIIAGLIVISAAVLN